MLISWLISVLIVLLVLVLCVLWLLLLTLLVYFVIDDFVAGNAVEIVFDSLADAVFQTFIVC